MATVRTVSFLCRIQKVCWYRKVTSDFVCGVNPAINYAQTRAASRASPLISDDTSKYSGYEVSRNPQEWKYVQDLLPKTCVPSPTPKAEYPSGWRPQNPPAAAPYFVQRTDSLMLPVYMVRSGVRGQRCRTVVRRVQGDIWALEKELIALLQRIYPREYIQIQVNEVAGQILVRGDYVNAIKEYLKSNGW